MPTGQQIITNALASLNVIDAGGAVSASENADLLATLNREIDELATVGALIPSIATAQYALSPTVQTFAIGPAATAPFNVARPVRIDQAVMLTTLGGGLLRKPLRLIGSTEYFAHADLQATALVSDELYVDYADVAGALTCYLYPRTSSATAIELETWTPIASFALAVNQVLPPGYENFLTNILAFLAVSKYGAVVNPTIAQLVADAAKQSRQRIAEFNVRNRLISPNELASVEPQQAPPQPQQAQR
jgi:hypothetical protein